MDYTFFFNIDNESIDPVFIEDNEGIKKTFNDEDFISLCRSGASTKKRKSNTIGFRGIGFKAVVNYANLTICFLSMGET